MSHLGKIVQLTGVTQKGKNRVREHGNRWTVLAETDRVLFAPNAAGPWLFVTPNPAGPGLGQDDKASRWVHANNDSDFKVVPMDS